MDLYNKSVLNGVQSSNIAANSSATESSSNVNISNSSVNTNSSNVGSSSSSNRMIDVNMGGSASSMTMPSTVGPSVYYELAALLPGIQLGKVATFIDIHPPVGDSRCF